MFRNPDLGLCVAGTVNQTKYRSLPYQAMVRTALMPCEPEASEAEVTLFGCTTYVGPGCDVTTGAVPGGHPAVSSGVSFRSVSPRKKAGWLRRRTAISTNPNRISPTPRMNTRPTPESRRHCRSPVSRRP